MARELPFWSFGGEAKGVIAVGNSAYGVLAIGGTVSAGVVSIGMNAVGVVAIGLNAAGPLSLSLINGAGILAWAGVNVLGGMGGSFVNAGISPWLGVALAVVGLVIGQVICSPRARPRVEGDPLDRLIEAGPGVYRIAASIERRERMLVLSEGDVHLEAEAPPSLARVGDRGICEVRVVEEFDQLGGYRVAAHKNRRLVVESVEPIASTGLLHAEADLVWLASRSLQLGSAIAGAICMASIVLG